MNIILDFEKLTRTWYCHAPHSGYLTTTLGKSMWDDPIEVPYVHCTRQPGHEGDHAAYTFSIREPEHWPRSENLSDPEGMMQT